MSTTNVTFVHKRELLLAKYGIVRELSILTKSLLGQQQFEAATAIAERLDANTEEFEKQLGDLTLFDTVVPVPVNPMTLMIPCSAGGTEQTPFEAIASGAAQIPVGATNIEVATNPTEPVV